MDKPTFEHMFALERAKRDYDRAMGGLRASQDALATSKPPLLALMRANGVAALRGAVGEVVLVDDGGFGQVVVAKTIYDLRIIPDCPDEMAESAPHSVVPGTIFADDLPGHIAGGA